MSAVGFLRGPGWERLGLSRVEQVHGLLRLHGSQTAARPHLCALLGVGVLLAVVCTTRLSAGAATEPEEAAGTTQHGRPVYFVATDTSHVSADSPTHVRADSPLLAVATLRPLRSPPHRRPAQVAAANMSRVPADSPMRTAGGRLDEAQPGWRALRFPADYSLGTLAVRTAAGTWEDIGPAQGTVRVQNGAHLRLSVFVQSARSRDLGMVGAVDDLCIPYLQDLEPGVLQALRLSSRLGDDAMQHVARLTGLRELDLEGSGVTDAGMQALGTPQNVEHLSLTREVTEATLEALAGWPALRSLAMPIRGRLRAAEVRALGRIRTLERLSIACRAKDIERLEPLVTLGRPARLEVELIGRGAPLPAESVRLLAAIPNLWALHIGGLELGADSLSALVGHEGLQELTVGSVYRPPGRLGAPHSGLRRSYPSGLRVPRGTLRALAGVPSLRRLEVLTRYKGQVEEFDVEELARVGSLDVLALQVRGHRLHTLEPLAILRNLREVSVDLASGVTDESVEALASLPRLEVLRLAGATLSDTSLVALSRVDSLRELDLREVQGPGFSRAGLAALAGLPALERLAVQAPGLRLGDLEELNRLRTLRGLRLSPVFQDGGGLDLSGLTALEALELRVDNDLRDGDVAGLVGLACLRDLELWPPTLTDRALAHVRGMGKLEKLTIGGPGVTDEGLAHLAELQRLTHLNVHVGRATEAGATHLASLPLLRTVEVTTGTGGRVAPAVQSLLQSTPGMATHVSCEVRTDVPAAVQHTAGAESAEVREALALRLAGVTGEPVDPASLRVQVLPFPDERSFGSVLLRPPATGGEAEPDDWVWIGEARGPVAIPADWQACLRLAEPVRGGLAWLERLPPDGLHRLELKRPVGDRDVAHVRALCGLRELSLRRSLVTPTGLAGIADMVKLERLELASREPTWLAAAARFASLKDLCCHGGGSVTDGSAAFLARLPHLERLELRGTARISDRGLAEVTSLERLQALELDLDPAPGTDLGAFSRLTELRSLVLRMRRANPQTALTFRGPRSLKKLEVHAPSIGIAALVSGPTAGEGLLGLRRLARPAWASGGLANLVNLEELTVTGGNDRDLTCIAGLGRLERLRRLNISAPKATDRGLGDLWRLPQLESLVLDIGELTAEGASHLGRLERLQAVGIRLRAGLPPEVEQQLRTALPDAAIALNRRPLDAAAGPVRRAGPP